MNSTSMLVILIAVIVLTLITVTSLFLKDSGFFKKCPECKSRLTRMKFVERTAITSAQAGCPKRRHQECHCFACGKVTDKNVIKVILDWPSKTSAPKSATTITAGGISIDFGEPSDDYIDDVPRAKPPQGVRKTMKDIGAPSVAEELPLGQILSVD